MSPPQQKSHTWLDLLEDASTPGAVIGVVRDFMATWTPGEIAALPSSCRPPAKFGMPEDVVLYAFTLVEHQLKSASAEDPVVFRMTGFFSEAARRMTLVMGETPQQRAANTDELEG